MALLNVKTSMPLPHPQSSALATLTASTAVLPRYIAAMAKSRPQPIASCCGGSLTGYGVLSYFHKVPSGQTINRPDPSASRCAAGKSEGWRVPRNHASSSSPAPTSPSYAANASPRSNTLVIVRISVPNVARLSPAYVLPSHAITDISLPFV